LPTQIKPCGSKRRDYPRRLEPPIKVNVRILSATNRNLEDSIEAGTFRSDLYHRLKVVTIRLPTLRERSQDIPILIDYL
jgi:two-component system response regulator HydG